MALVNNAKNDEGENMFCVECAAELDPVWKVCPHCGTPAMTESKSISISDSVVMGDVNINPDHHQCKSCGSTGETRVACKECKELMYCKICEDDYYQEFCSMLWNDAAYSDDYRQQDRYDYEEGESNYHPKYHPSKFPETERICSSCLTEKVIPEMNRKCWSCGLHCRGKMKIRIDENETQSYYTCQKCMETHDIYDLDETSPGGVLVVLKKQFESWREYHETHSLKKEWWREPSDRGGYGGWGHKRSDFTKAHWKRHEDYMATKDKIVTIKINVPIPEPILEKIRRAYPPDLNPNLEGVPSRAWKRKIYDVSQDVEWRFKHSIDDDFRRSNFWHRYN